MTSLRGRLTWGLMLSLVLLLGLQWLVVTYAIQRLTEEQLATRLQLESESLLAGIRFDAQGAIQLDDQHVSAIFQRPFSGHYYAIATPRQRLLSRSLWDADLAFRAISPGEQRMLRLTGPERQPLLATVHGYVKRNLPVTILVAADLTAMQAGLMRFQMMYAAVSAAGLVLLLLLQRMIVLNALSPLQKLQQNLIRLGRGEADHIEAHGPSEIMPLIDELNRLLGGMVRRTRRSREALGNLAHALKTRLTLLNQAAERPEIAAMPEVRNQIHASTAAIGQIVERELKRARLVGNSGPGRRIDLELEIAQLMKTMQLLYAEKGVEFDWSIAPEASFIGDREDLLELLGNLLDNAAKWCARRVALTVSGNGAVWFIVEDDGPGYHGDHMEALVQRGFRADESKPGSGLGLAIVQDIVESYGGTLEFGKAATLGGLRVEVCFTSSLPQD
jgi:signal transduction histidine kinase